MRPCRRDPWGRRGWATAALACGVWPCPHWWEVPGGLRGEGWSALRVRCVAVTREESKRGTGARRSQQRLFWDLSKGRSPQKSERRDAGGGSEGQRAASARVGLGPRSSLLRALEPQPWFPGVCPPGASVTPGATAVLPPPRTSVGDPSAPHPLRRGGRARASSPAPGTAPFRPVPVGFDQRGRSAPRG